MMMTARLFDATTTLILDEIVHTTMQAITEPASSALSSTESGW